MLNNTPQANSPQLDNGKHKAALGQATYIMSHLIQPQQGQQIAQNSDPNQGAPENQDTPTDTKAEMQGLESRIFDELGTLRQEIQKAVAPKDQNQELQDLKDQLQAIIDAKE